MVLARLRFVNAISLSGLAAVENTKPDAAHHSNAIRPQRLIASFQHGTLVTLRNTIPTWAENIFTKEFARLRETRHLNSI